MYPDAGKRVGPLAKAALRPAKRLLERMTGLKILRSPPHGLDLHADIRRLAPVERIHTILDVGANIGQSALPLARMYPRAAIHSFEPSLESYQLLHSTAAQFDNVHPHRLGVGEAKVAGFLAPGDRSTLHRLVLEPDSPDLEQVEVTTVTDFCSENSIGYVSLLKVDTEGHDLKVLQGAASMLAASRIDFVQVEAGFGADNVTHVDFRDILAFMQERRYSLFGFYEQKHEWPSRMPLLRRSDVVFISRAVCSRNAGKAPR